MAMIRPKGKAGKIATSVLKSKGVQVLGSSGKKEKVKDKTPFLQHQEHMDKLINKVKKDLAKGQKDVKVLKKADKKFDRKIAKCDKVMKRKK